MSGKLMFGGLVAVAALALTAGTASAHPPGFYQPVPVYQPVYRPVYQPVFVQPIYRPVFQPAFPVYNSGFGFASPAFGGYNSGFGYGSGFNHPVYGGGFNNGFYGRPSVGLSFNFIR